MTSDSLETEVIRNMAKSTVGKSARFRVQRRLGTELPGLGKPGALERRPYPPGENGNKRRKYSDYALRLEEKQKIRVHYQLREEQLRRFIRNSKRGSAANWVNTLMGLLECRLDNLVFRLGFAPSIRAARQLVSHRHVLVNGAIVNVGSYVVPQGGKISIKEKARENQIVLQAQKAPRLEVPDYLRKETEGGTEVGVIQAIPGTEHVPFQFDAGLFTEYYAARKA
jgi:small subunit ribosomal protein S4